MNSITTSFKMGRFLQHLYTQGRPFILRQDGNPPNWDDQAVHEAAYEQDVELYALLALETQLNPWQRTRMLFQILEPSRKAMSAETCQVLERVTGFLLSVISPDQVLTVFLALRRMRANHKHIRRAILRYILNHPELEDMAVHRRPALVDSLEHAIGKDVARACAKYANQAECTTHEAAYLRRNLLRFADDPQCAKKVLRFLYRYTTLTLSTESDYKDAYIRYLEHVQPATDDERPKTITATNRGDIAATLVHIYRGGASSQLMQALDDYVTEAASQLPRSQGKIALVLDASLSTQGYGEREYCIISQSVALQKVLEKCCANLQVYYVGGSGNPPRPEGHTDLASGLLAALEGEPDLVAIISDGYENVYQNDLARVIISLPLVGIETPVVFCHSKFTGKDDLTLRRPVSNIPEFEFWHQKDFLGIVIALFSMARAQNPDALRAYLLERLDELEQEPKWTFIKSYPNP